MSDGDTLSGLLQRNARTSAGLAAMREKRHGIWQTVSWAGHEAATTEIARGLAALGFRKGDRLAVLGDNRPALYRAMLAAMSLGGGAVPCWPDAGVDWLAHVLNDASVSVVIAEDEDQVTKILSIRDQLPSVKAVVYTDPRGLHADGGALVRSLSALLAAGEVSAPAPAAEANGLAVICYVTPAEGPPRGVPLTHANLIAAARAVTQLEDVRPTDEYLCYLPMAWVAEVLYGLALPLLVGFACSCPEDPETARRDLRELGPTILLAPPRIWDSLLSDIRIRAAHATPLKRRLCERYLPDPFALKPRSGRGMAAKWLVSAPLRDQLGLRRLRWAHTGGLPMAPHRLAFFRSIGVNLRQGFGPAETAGLATLSHDGDSLGAAAPGMDLRIGPEETLCLRGRALFRGYRGDTTPSLDPDGWWDTGLSATLEPDRRLRVLGPRGEQGRLSDGTSFAPQNVENALRGGRFVADAYVVGDGQDFPAALIEVDLAAAGDWAQTRGLSYASTADLLALPDVAAAVRDEVAQANESLPPALGIRRWRLLEGPPAAAGSEAGLSRVLRRRLALAENAEAVASLFGKLPDARVATLGDTRPSVRERVA